MVERYKMQYSSVLEPRFYNAWICADGLHRMILREILHQWYQANYVKLAALYVGKGKTLLSGDTEVHAIIRTHMMLAIKEQFPVLYS